VGCTDEQKGGGGRGDCDATRHPFILRGTTIKNRLCYGNCIFQKSASVSADPIKYEIFFVPLEDFCCKNVIFFSIHFVGEAAVQTVQSIRWHNRCDGRQKVGGGDSNGGRKRGHIELRWPVLHFTFKIFAQNGAIWDLLLENQQKFLTCSRTPNWARIRKWAGPDRRVSRVAANFFAWLHVCLKIETRNLKQSYIINEKTFKCISLQSKRK